MKQIKLLLSALILSQFLNAQSIPDTMIIRPDITMQAQDWCWLRGKLAEKDSALLTIDRRIHNIIKPQLPLQWTSNVTFDSLPGRLVYAFYQVLKTANAGEIVSRYTAINNALSGVTQLAYWYGRLDAALDADRQMSIGNGKNVYVDQ